jgi:hypothetical protein
MARQLGRHSRPDPGAHRTQRSRHLHRRQLQRRRRHAQP